jgi:hypothetical protein
LQFILFAVGLITSLFLISPFSPEGHGDEGFHHSQRDLLFALNQFVCLIKGPRGIKKIITPILSDHCKMIFAQRINYKPAVCLE